MRKSERQQLIETLIKRKRLSTQGELVAALEALGCQVTQATVSRDMRELGVQKGVDSRGRGRYAIPLPRERRDPAEQLARVLRESGASVQAAQNLVVLRCDPGTAPNLGRALDEWEQPEIIGTVAGDDTVLIVLADSAQARRLVRQLSQMMPAG